MQLNPQQSEAVHYVDGPLLVLAGAGSGKTRVITQKIAHLITQHSYLPEKIAAVTFTNKAAREMRQRVGKLVRGTDVAGLNVCTFHALGLRIVRTQLEALGLRPGFSIFDPRDCLAVLREILPKGSSPDALENARQVISRLKGGTQARPLNAAEAALLGAYTERLRGLNAVDFDDLIALPLELLENNSEARADWQHRLRYILVDEYQDTNASQYRLLQLLLGEGGALTAVGDDDQSIYGWRGAQPENLSLLGQDFPDLKVIKLEQNYRSVRTVLEAANKLIAHNAHAIEKRLWSELAPGDPIAVRPADDEHHEAERIVSELMARHLVSRADYGDCAVLYRSNHQARRIEQALRAQKIPYILSGGQSYFDRAEIRDLITYLRLLGNPADDQAFLRVVNTPRRGVGGSSLEALCRRAGEIGRSLWATAADREQLAGLPGRAGLAVARFVEWMADLRNSGLPPDRLLQRVVEDTDYLEYLRTSAKDEMQAQRRVQAVEDLQRWVADLCERTADLSEVLQALALASEQDDDDEASGAVRLMTIHAAKGLEFKHVMVAGCEEGLLPHGNSVEDGQIAEERRLMYVAITRAQHTLVLSYAQRRRGEKVKYSRFLDEIPPALLNWEGQDVEADESAARERGQAHLKNLRSLLAE